ncbi:MAG TPA: hypothetical protein VHA52_11065 [Candidatus Babeliaceae bacterium]|nr:hypothetical protein [Candidatus Babeliaceae bacterium]
MMIHENKVVSVKKVEVEKTQSLIGRVEHFFGFGPRGCYTFHRTVEQLVNGSFAEVMSRLKEISSLEDPTSKISEMRQILEDMKSIQTITKEMNATLLEQYNSAPIFVRIWLVILKFFSIRAQPLLNHPIDSRLQVCKKIINLFDRIPLWSAYVNGRHFTIWLTFETNCSSLIIRNEDSNQWSWVYFSNRASRIPHVHLRFYSAEKIVEVQTLIARFFNTLRNQTNVFADITADFPLKDHITLMTFPKRNLLDDRGYRRYEAWRNEDALDLLLYLQQELDALHFRPSSWTDLRTLVKVLRTGL